MTPGNFVWNELETCDVEAAKAFCAATTGWTFEGMRCRIRSAPTMPTSEQAAARREIISPDRLAHEPQDLYCHEALLVIAACCAMKARFAPINADKTQSRARVDVGG